MCKSWTENSCRICLDTPEECNMLTEMYSLLQENVTLQEMFTACTQLHISLDDAFPQQICTDCCNELKLSYQFIQKAKRADSQLRCWVGAEESTALRDPLEDSPTELDAINKVNSSSDSDEDNKPLIDLISEAAKRREKLGANEKTILLDEQPVNVAEPSGSLSDLALSAEQQLFPKGRFKCKICSKLYFTMIGLKTHLDIHLGDNTNGKKKRSRQSQRRKTLKGKISEEVTLCDSRNANEIPKIKEELNPSEEDGQLLQEDNKSHKAKQLKPKKMFPCPECGKQMISASKLRYHIVMHTGAKDYLCTMCPKAYSTIYALKHHFRSHTGERPYECKFCGDRFTRPTTLKSHTRRHTGERPYGCDICGKRFIQHSSMTTHMKLNHMAKTIPCPHCKKKYARQTDLNTHLLSHSGEKPFSCQLCPSRFIRQANLNKHMNQQHSGKMSKEAHLADKMTNSSIAMEEAQNEVDTQIVMSSDVKLEAEVSQSVTDQSLFITPSFTIDEELQPAAARYPYEPAPLNGNISLENSHEHAMRHNDLSRWNWHTQA